MIITLDGPAGAGKSTVAKRLALRLSEVMQKRFEYLDTGSMYRTVVLIGLRKNIDWDQPTELETLAREADIRIINGRTLLNDEDVTDDVRTQEVTQKIHFAADNSLIRQRMVELQRLIAQQCFNEGKGLVTEGRDQGTVVFSDTPFKFFITASPEERTRRRLGEMVQRGETGEFDDILKSITERDYRDSTRDVAPLRKPEDAHHIVTDEMTIDEVVEHLMQIIQKTKTAFL